MRWTFSIEHVAGATNYGPDALSRFPGPAAKPGTLGAIKHDAHEWSAGIEGQVLATAASRHPLVVSWDILHVA